MKYRVDNDWWEYKISELAKVIQSGKVMPPLIVQYIDGEFELNDGNHRHKVYEGLGIEKTWVIIWITEEKELKDFMCQYHNLFLRMALGNIGYITTILAFNDNCLYVPQTPEDGKLLTLLYVE